MNLAHSKRDLKHAKDEYKAMVESKSMDDFEAHWRRLLVYLEQAFEKVNHGMAGIKKFHGWNSKYVRDRKKDPLLKYLWAARNCEAHSIREIVERKNGGISITSTGATTIRSLAFLFTGEVLADAEGSPLKVKYTKPRVETVRIENRGEWFSVPTSHQNQAIIKPSDPLTLAKLGIDYYERYLAKVENTFKGESSTG